MKQYLHFQIRHSQDCSFLQAQLQHRRPNQQPGCQWYFRRGWALPSRRTGRGWKLAAKGYCIAMEFYMLKYVVSTHFGAKQVSTALRYFDAAKSEYDTAFAEFTVVFEIFHICLKILLKTSEFWHWFVITQQIWWGCTCLFKGVHTVIFHFWYNITKDRNRYRREPSTCKSCFMWKQAKFRKLGSVSSKNRFLQCRNRWWQEQPFSNDQKAFRKLSKRNNQKIYTKRFLDVFTNFFCVSGMRRDFNDLVESFSVLFTQVTKICRKTILVVEKIGRALIHSYSHLNFWFWKTYLPQTFGNFQLFCFQASLLWLKQTIVKQQTPRLSWTEKNTNLFSFRIWGS